MPNPDGTKTAEEIAEEERLEAERIEAEKSKKGQTTPEIEALVQARVDAALKEIKGKLDKSYEARNEAQRKLAELEEARKAEAREQLKKDGKIQEALEAEISELRAKNQVLEKRIIELGRDGELRAALGALDFRSQRASEVAFREIVDSLEQDDKGNWKDKTGKTIPDIVKALSEDPEQSFLFKTRENSGGGGRNNSSSSKTGGKGSEKKTSIFQRSQAEVLAEFEADFNRQNK